MLIIAPPVRATVQTPCDQAKAFVRFSCVDFSASNAVHAGTQTAELNPPAKPTPPIAAANSSEFKSCVKAKKTYATAADRRPHIVKGLRPYLSAAIANGMSATVFARAETADTAPITSPENPISLK